MRQAVPTHFNKDPQRQGLVLPT
jgi:hypothetical protein